MSSSSALTVGEIVRILDSRFNRFFHSEPIMGQIIEPAKRNRFKVRLGVNECRRYRELLDTDDHVKIPALALERWTDWKPEARALFLFGDGHHSLQTFKKPFSSDGPCMHSEHDGQTPPAAVRRILINCWGTVCEFDVCKAHVDLDGCCMEDLPLGKPFRKESA